MPTTESAAIMSKTSFSNSSPKIYAPSILSNNPAERILSVLVSGSYRRNSLARMQLAECRPSMLSALGRCINRDLPVQLTVLAFPFKVPNPAKVGRRKLPDFAELAAIHHCFKLRATVQEIYRPGLEIHILHDGLFVAEVFGIERAEVYQYEAYFATLIKLAGASSFIRCHDFETLQQRSGLDPSGSIEALRLAAQQWWRQNLGTGEWQLSFRKTLGMINLRDFPAVSVTDLLHPASPGRLRSGWKQVEDRVHKAMVQYHVKDAIIHQFDPRPCCFPDAIHATTQERPGRLSLWMVRRGQSLLPWHGVGCLDHRGQAQVAHAIQVINDRMDYCPEFIDGEDTPFVYRKRTASAPLALSWSNERRSSGPESDFS
jgi:pyoverdine/dityrosine biosynthesis protein Dit1